MPIIGGSIVPVSDTPMKTATVMPLMQVFVSTSDPRSSRHTQHDLAELLTVMVCAVLSGADDFVAVHLWAKAKLDWLRGFMRFKAASRPTTRGGGCSG